MVRIDARASLTPLTLLRIGSLLRELHPGDGVELLCDDDSTLEDLLRIHPNWECRRAGRAPAEEGGRLFVLIKKRTNQP